MMKSYICLTAFALLIVASGCAPRLAETPLGAEEKRWEGYIKKSYPAWKAPQTVPPTNSEGKIEVPATEFASDSEGIASLSQDNEAVVIQDVIIKDSDGKVVSETVTAFGAEEKSKTYVVQKNDTLWKISRKFYNDGKKWKKIQSANDEVLKGSSKVLPGMTLQIPLP